MTKSLVAIQLEMSESALASGDAYRRHIEAATDRAVDQALAAAGDDKPDARLLVFPEVAGHMAIYALAPERAHKAKTLAAALATAIVRRPLDMLRGFTTARRLDPQAATLAAFAPDAERFWKTVFGALARKHVAHVVAGSHLRLGTNGELTNASLLFGPDGRMLVTTDKVNLVPGKEDSARGALGLARGDTAVPITDTPFGKLVTLLSYDAFREPHTSVERFIALPPLLQERGGVDVVASPSASPYRWQAQWLHAPAGERLTRAEQWDRDGLTSSLRQTPFARLGITAHLVGKVLDLEWEGVSEIVERVGSEVRVLARAKTHDRGEQVCAIVS